MIEFLIKSAGPCTWYGDIYLCVTMYLVFAFCLYCTCLHDPSLGFLGLSDNIILNQTNHPRPFAFVLLSTEILSLSNNCCLLVSFCFCTGWWGFFCLFCLVFVLGIFCLCVGLLFFLSIWSFLHSNVICAVKSLLFQKPFISTIKIMFDILKIRPHRV